MRATVLPAGSVPPVASLKRGEISVEIIKAGKDAGGGIPLEVKYPDGWMRGHQVKNIAELVIKITNNLRARYGCEDVKTLVTGELKAGTLIKMEVL